MSNVALTEMGKTNASSCNDDAASNGLPGRTDQVSGSPSNSTTSFPSENAEKSRLIEQACQERDVASLIQLADAPGGLLDDTLRKAAWPLLVGCDDIAGESAADACWKELPPHRDEGQVELDVNRAFVYYPNGKRLTKMGAEAS